VGRQNVRRAVTTDYCHDLGAMELDPLVIGSVVLVVLTIAFFALRSGGTVKKPAGAKFLDKSRQTLELGALRQQLCLFAPGLPLVCTGLHTV